MVERLSTSDDTFISSFADHILRYQFAESYCRGKRVLDAGCGIGYGSAYIAKNGAQSVLAIDISAAALEEARKLFKAPNLEFKQQDVETIGRSLGSSFDVIVNFENIEHISNPGLLVSGASKLLPQGVFITSTPNGANSSYGIDGRLANEFHVKEFTAAELEELLAPHFRSVTLHGQWLTPSGKMRKLRARQLFDDLNEAYYNPASRIGRVIKRAIGKKSLPPPNFFGEADSFEGDYVISPLSEKYFPWDPTIILAVCTN